MLTWFSCLPVGGFKHHFLGLELFGFMHVGSMGSRLNSDSDLHGQNLKTRNAGDKLPAWVKTGGPEQTIPGSPVAIAFCPCTLPQQPATVTAKSDPGGSQPSSFLRLGGLSGSSLSSQWHPFCHFFFVAAPLEIVFPKKGSLFFPGSLNN